MITAEVRLNHGLVWLSGSDPVRECGKEMSAMERQTSPRGDYFIHLQGFPETSARHCCLFFQEEALSAQWSRHSFHLGHGGLGSSQRGLSGFLWFSDEVSRGHHAGS